MEYQYQLHSDLDDSIHIPTFASLDPATYPEATRPRVYHFQTVGSVGLALVDTRFERSLYFDADHVLLSPTQHAELALQLEQWERDPLVAHVVLASSVRLPML